MLRKDTKWLPEQYKHLGRDLCLDFLSILDASCSRIRPFWKNWELQSQVKLQNTDNCFKEKIPPQQKDGQRKPKHHSLLKKLALS